MSAHEGSNWQNKKEDAGKPLYDNEQIKKGIPPSGARGGTKWLRYRFYTKSINDYRPLIFNPKYPWWCSGEGDNHAVIIAYLPPNEDLKKYWDDAHDIDFTEENKIEFTSRFPKPSYFIES